MWRPKGFAHQNRLLRPNSHHFSRIGPYRRGLPCHAAYSAGLGLGMADRDVAYKFLTVRGSDSRYAVIALRNPVAEDWSGFRRRTQIFGEAAYVYTTIASRSS